VENPSPKLQWNAGDSVSHGTRHPAETLAIMRNTEREVTQYWLSILPVHARQARIMRGVGSFREQKSSVSQLR
jgi:hypothetical protein